jgi:hypothetical protein
MATKPFEVAVLNTIQAAAADAVLSSGKFTLNDGSVDLLTNVELTDTISYTATAYAAGTAEIATMTVNSATNNSEYSFSINFLDSEDPNPLLRSRTYKVWSDATATVTEIAAAFVAAITADTDALVTATNAAGVITITQDDAADGDLSFTVNTGDMTAATTTPHVAPAGTPAIVEVDFPGESSATATYTTYDLVVRLYRRNNRISGAFTHQEVIVRFYADAGAANYAAFNTEIGAIFGGTHTPVADYLGV